MEPRPYHPALKSYSINFPTRLVFGTDSLRRLGEELKPFSPKKAMLVAGGSVSKTQTYKRVLELIPAESVLEYRAIPPEPDEDALAALSEEVCREKPDLVVGLGGGSTLDMAKLASLIAGNMKDPLPFFKGEPVARRGPPVITVPTIAGTGSEVTPISVVTSRGVKLALNHPFLFPTLSVIDPALSLTAPPSATASAGIDALNHAVESIMSLESNPLTASLAFEAIHLADENLERAYANGEDLDARIGLSLSSAMAGMAFANTGLCITHGIAYTYAVKLSLPHGPSVALAEPYVIEFNAPAIPGKLEVIAAGFGIGIDGLSPAEAGEAIALRYLEIMGTLGLPMSLEDLGLAEADLEPLVDDFTNNHSRFMVRNPRRASKKELLRLYATMLEGH